MTQRQDVESVSIASPVIGDEEKARVESVLDSGHLAAGDVVAEFEERFADYCGVDHAVAVTNGTTALHAALEAVGVGPGSTVVTTPLSFVATANAVRLAGGEVAFADVDPETLTIDPGAVEQHLQAANGDVDAILPVHLYGLPAEMDRLRELGERYDVPIVEDAAQAHGAEFDGDPVGSIGDVGCFSFYPTKNMTTGEGGMVVTDRDEVARRVRSFINHGRRPDDGSVHERVGHNFRMTDLAAAIGCAQLDRLPGFVEQRRENARTITERIADTPVETPPDPEGVKHAYHQYTIQTDDRAGLREHLAEFGIDTGVYYDTPIHEQPAYDGVTARAPVAERACEEVLSLPVHPELTNDQVDAIATAMCYYDTYE